MRGLEHCSTSYASGPHVTVPRFGRQRCPACKPHTQRLRVVAAEAKDMQLIQTAHGPRLPDGSNAFVPIRLNMREAENGDWVDKVDDWWAFWQDGYINYGPEDIEMDDIHDALTMTKEERSDYRHKCQDAIYKQMMTDKWRENHPEAVYNLPNPDQTKFHPDVPEPEPEAVRDWNEFELRAFEEKHYWQADEDALWTQRMDDVGRYGVVNVTPENDVRLMPRFEPLKEWTHEEIWGMITNNGVNCNPDDVQMRIFNPLRKSDYFAEGIQYVPETEEWLAMEGHWWENEEEPDLEQEISMLASDFSDINVGNSADEGDQQVVEGDREEDSSPESEDATQLGKLFGPIDL